MHRKAVERWLYGALMNWHHLAIFQRQYDFSFAVWDRLLVCACKAPGGEQGFHWKVAGRVEGCDVLPDGDPWDHLQSPNCKKRVSNCYIQMAGDY
jgi:hypothetical protein